MPVGTIVPSYGTLTILDTLAASPTTTIYNFGEDRVWEGLILLLAAHNRMLAELRDMFCVRTSERLMRFGGATQMGMDELDEHGIPDAQKVTAGATCGFPLRKYGASLQWTLSYFRKMKSSEFAAQITAMLDGDVYNVIRQIKRGLYLPTNYTFIDKLVDQQVSYPLPVKALVNADSLPIMPGPNGETFPGASHTHYLGATSGGTFADADLTSAVNTVVEHFTGNASVAIFINSGNETALRGFTPNFSPVYDNTLIIADTVTRAKGELNTIAINNRRIGTYRGADVWVKPWAPLNYALVCMTSGAEKPLRWRYDPDTPDDFGLVYENESHPLRARSYERNFGIGVYGRTSAAILDIAHTTYNAPTIA